MNITFDPRDPSQLSAVAKIIDVMSGGNAFASIATDPDKFKLDGSEDVPAPVESTVAAQTAADIDGALPLPTPAATEAAPVAETPATPPASPTPQHAIGDVDTTGMPWDARIHAGTKSQKKDGTWTLKRGVDKEVVKQVEAELRAQIAPPPAVPVPQMPVTAPPAQAAPAAPTPMVMPAGDVEMPVASGIAMPAGDQPAPVTAPPAQAAPTPAPAQPAPQPAAAPPAQAAPAPLDFTGLMTKVSQSMNTGKITGDYLGTVVNRLNAQAGTQFTAITDLSQAPEHIPTVDAMIAADQCW